MKFQVPQFIEKESKLVGPLTLKQFLWFLGAGIAFILLQFFVTGIPLIVITIVIVGLAAFFAFGKIDNVSAIDYVLNAIVYLLAPKKLFFRDEDTKES